MVYYIYILLDECKVFGRVHLLPLFPSVSSSCLFCADSSLGLIPQNGSEADSIFVHKVLKVSQVKMCKVCISSCCISTSLFPRRWSKYIPSRYVRGFNKGINNLLVLVKSLSEWTLKVHLNCLYFCELQNTGMKIFCHQLIGWRSSS